MKHTYNLFSLFLLPLKKHITADKKKANDQFAIDEESRVSGRLVSRNESLNIDDLDIGKTFVLVKIASCPFS